MDSKSIEEMYVKYYTALKRYCIKLVSYNSRYSDIAEDCVQEAFYRAVCNAEDFESSPNQYGWLVTCCSHYMLSHIRQSKKREAIIGKTVSLEAYGDVPDLMDNVLAWIAHTEYQETVEEFMAELSPLEHKVFRAYYEKGLSLKETAQHTKLSTTSVRGALDRIRAKGRHFHPMLLFFIGQCILSSFKPRWPPAAPRRRSSRPGPPRPRTAPQTPPPAPPRPRPPAG